MDANPPDREATWASVVSEFPHWNHLNEQGWYLPCHTWSHTPSQDRKRATDGDSLPNILQPPQPKKPYQLVTF